MRDAGEGSAPEVRKLFAELGEIYARAQEAAESDTPGGPARIGEERSKASAIIARIRDVHGL